MMADVAEAAAVVAPAVPVVTEAAPVVETPAVDTPMTAREKSESLKAKPTEGRTAKDAKDGLARRLNSPREAAPAVEATESVAVVETPSTGDPAATQPRDESGKFVKVEEAPAAKAPEGRIAIPEGHPIRETRGKQYTDELELHELKPFVSEGAWAKISESLRAQNIAQAEAARNADLQKQVAEHRAKAEVLSDPASNPLADPKVRAVYEDLKQAYGEDEAARYIRSLETERDGKVAEKAAEISRTMEAENAARSFLDSVRASKDTAQKRYTVWQGAELDTQLDRVLDVFVPLVEKGQYEATAQAFYKFADMMYLQDPRAAAAFKQAQANLTARQQKEAAERARVEAENAAKAAEAERLKQAAANRRTVPLSGVGGGLPASQDGRPRSAAEQKQALTARMRNQLTR